MSRFADEGRTALAAVGFFTRFPVPGDAMTTASLGRAITWFPLVGWLVGATAALAWWAGGLVWPPPVAAGVAIASAVLLTGALHEDGFADVCDGFGGGSSRERTLAILKDPHIGVFGVLGLISLTGLTWSALTTLPGAIVPAALLALHSMSRGVAASLMAVLDYARPAGEASKARALSTRLRGGRLAVVGLTASLPLVLLPWPSALALLVCAGTVFLAAAAFFGRRLGGYTGDCLGASQQVMFAAGLLVLLAGR